MPLAKHPLFNNDLPEIPLELTPVGFDRDKEFYNVAFGLWLQVILEICHPTYATRSHSNVGTYDQGCRGPLCRKALREHPRRRNPEVLVDSKLLEQRMFDPILEYFQVVAKQRISIYKAELLERLMK